MPQKKVSVIISTKNSQRTLDACLKSIKNQTYENIELIVVDNNSTDNTEKIARKYADKFFVKGPERSAQRNFGARESIGDYLLIHDSDIYFPKGVVEECVKVIESNNADALIMPEESIGEGFWAKVKKFEKSFYVSKDLIEAPRFFRREVYDNVGGYDEGMTGGEDWDLGIRLKKNGYKIARTNIFLQHDEGRVNVLRSSFKKMYYAKDLFENYSKKNPEEFKKQTSFFYRFSIGKIFEKGLWHPILFFGLVIMKTTEYITSRYYILIKNKKEKKVYKSIIPDLVSLDINSSHIRGFHLSEDLNFFKNTNEKSKFHYRVVITNDIQIPEDYDFRSEYFTEKNGCWFYDRRVLFLHIKFKYDSKEKVFYISKAYAQLPFRVGGFFPAGEYIRDMICLDLLFEGYFLYRGCSFIKNGSTFCIVAPGMNGKTEFLVKELERGSSYIAEDNLIVNFQKKLVYPTCPFTKNNWNTRSANLKLKKLLSFNGFATKPNYFDYIWLVQNSLNREIKINPKDMKDYLFLSPPYFIDSLFIRSFLFKNDLVSKMLSTISGLSDIESYKFVAVKNFNFDSLC